MCKQLTKTAIWSNHTIVHQNTIVGFNNIPDILWRIDSFTVPIQKENFETKSISNITQCHIQCNSSNNINNNNNTNSNATNVILIILILIIIVSIPQFLLQDFSLVSSTKPGGIFVCNPVSSVDINMPRHFITTDSYLGIIIQIIIEVRFHKSTTNL